MSNNLKGIYIIERDTNEDLFSWAFPALDLTLENILKARCGLAGPSSTAPNVKFLDRPFYSKFKDSWLYFLTFKAPEPHKEDSQITAYSMVLIADNFNTAQYYSLLSLLANAFKPTLTSTAILSSFIAASATGRALVDGNRWVASSFDPRMSYVSPISSLINLLGLESVLLFVASITNQRIWVHDTDPIDLGNFVRAAASFGAWHREPWNTLRPLIGSPNTLTSDIQALEMDDVAGCSVVGTLHSNAINRQDLWDIFVDIPSRSVTIAEHAQSKFTMGKYHKTIAEGLIQLSQDEESDSTARDMRIIKFCVHKSKELVDQVKSCAEEAKDDEKIVVTAASLRANGIPASMENFLLLVAKAEGLTPK